MIITRIQHVFYRTPGSIDLPYAQHIRQDLRDGKRPDITALAPKKKGMIRSSQRALARRLAEEGRIEFKHDQFLIQDFDGTVISVKLFPKVQTQCRCGTMCYHILGTVLTYCVHVCVLFS